MLVFLAIIWQTYICMLNDKTWKTVTQMKTRHQWNIFISSYCIYLRTEIETTMHIYKRNSWEFSQNRGSISPYRYYISTIQLNGNYSQTTLGIRTKKLIKQQNFF